MRQEVGKLVYSDLGLAWKKKKTHSFPENLSSLVCLRDGFKVWIYINLGSQISQMKNNRKIGNFTEVPTKSDA